MRTTHFKQTTRVWALATLSIIVVSSQARPVLADEFGQYRVFRWRRDYGIRPGGLFHR